MKRLVLCNLYLVLCVCSFTFAQDSVSISDFRYPETRAIDWKGGINGNFGNQQYYYSPFNQLSPLSYRKDKNVSGTIYLNSTFALFHTKDYHDHSLTTNFSISYNQAESDIERNDTGVVWKQTNDGKRIDDRFEFQWTYNHYFDEEGFHLIGSTDFRYNGTYIENRNTYSLNSEQHNIGKWYNLKFDGEIGLGYGRMRDGTIVFQAIRIIERLREDGIITKYLTREQMLLLVDRIAHRREYLTNYERYEKYFVRDIVEELSMLGLISENEVNSFSTLRILETFGETIRPRFFGWRIYYTFGGRHTQYSNESSSGTDFSNDWVDLYTIGGDIGYPLSLRTHASINVNVELPNQDYSRKLDIEMTATITHEVTERIDVVGMYSFERQASNITRLSYSDNWTRDIEQSISGNFIYYLEDNFRFSTSLYYFQYISTDYNDKALLIPQTRKSSSLSFSFGLNYNIF